MAEFTTAAVERFIKAGVPPGKPVSPETLMIP